MNNWNYKLPWNLYSLLSSHGRDVIYSHFQIKTNKQKQLSSYDTACPAHLLQPQLNWDQAHLITNHRPFFFITLWTLVNPVQSIFLLNQISWGLHASSIRNLAPQSIDLLPTFGFPYIDLRTETSYCPWIPAEPGIRFPWGLKVQKEEEEEQEEEEKGCPGEKDPCPIPS